MNVLDHIGLYVKDLKGSSGFYGEVLGFEVVRTMETSTSKIVFLDTGEGLLELIQRPGAPGKAPEGPWSHVAFKVDDYDAMESKLEGMGLELRKVVLGDGSRIAFFKDPDGHDVEIME
ncbi:MAG: VOC family protein [Candidatus Bathyarchaeota archaeon]|jgi:catechol 2,3-dioxygenase-like lactoylglutathione lyase family enzyme